MNESLAVFGRADAAQLTEHSRKVLLGFESAGHRNIQHPPFSGAQDFLGMLHSMAEDKLMWALTGRLAKHLREVGYAQSHRFRHRFKSQVVVDLRIH